MSDHFSSELPNQSGWILIDKPASLTSFDIVRKVRQAYNVKKVGHAGTLDPLATGLLILALGSATKSIDKIVNTAESYLFTLKWGEERDTEDSEGKVTNTSDFIPSEEEIMAIVPFFLGESLQIPPHYSAIKINGKRAYEKAREGEKWEMAPRPIIIDTLTYLESATFDTANFSVTCSKGTYVRSLARDIARKLGSCAHITAIRRTHIGPYAIENAVTLDSLNQIPLPPLLAIL